MSLLQHKAIIFGLFSLLPNALHLLLAEGTDYLQLQTFKFLLLELIDRLLNHALLLCTQALFFRSTIRATHSLKERVTEGIVFSYPVDFEALGS